ncbi:substrate-binding domain-containing protein [Riemerella anatipestifer]|uniref:Phosphate ABC transporter substrate-binding protein, phot family n=2 Tax=Riemerella anatipestifer TaxID=34085 RepID=E4TC59_RIEAD|nr:substrate-binding domain-containing protein [Riemerella anatipestifer]ADQ82106.1 phosphate ABC transporter substrate-binding protein, PhoT family [Riemerella anatipestifer ATCC 11845 = DSM 15868]ADZ12395.1 putative phosphate ABC transporter, phosphate- binding component [Riemerella anatipestifer RA-GD]AFD56108.1 phosphate ABC transporter substrate-binding protein, phot family [Riemerella anatipestifer ATCC 11845 = DSM 15868]AKQ40165.1 phosphate ABC transporter substrate-binding protein [Riem
MYKRIGYLLFLLVVMLSCKKGKEAENPQKGEIQVVADPSFKNVTEALTERYMAFYPEAKLDVLYKKEDSAFIDLLEGRARVIVMSRELSEREKEVYKSKVDLEYNPAKFAGDAVVFIVPKNSNREHIKVSEIKEMLNSESKNLIFDGTNASNLNFIAQKFNAKPSALKYSIIRGNENIVNNIGEFSDKIGVISLNTISREFSPEAIALREKVKVLPVMDEKGKIYKPELSSIRNMEYPFSRILYFLTNEGFFGVGNGFIRFSCTQIGQIVVSKQGLQPYNIYKREVQMR